MDRSRGDWASRCDGAAGIVHGKPGAANHPGLFETGAGGSAPKHVQQLEAKNHLRWDSLGEFLALAVSIEDLAEKTKNVKARVVAGCLNDAISKVLSWVEIKRPVASSLRRAPRTIGVVAAAYFSGPGHTVISTQVLSENKSPLRKPGLLDNRGSHFYLALFWADAVAAQTQAPDLAAKFAPAARPGGNQTSRRISFAPELSQRNFGEFRVWTGRGTAQAAALLAANEDRILEELAVGAHAPADVGGYYKVDAAKADAVMRPSPTMNAIIDSLTAGVHLDASEDIKIAA